MQGEILVCPECGQAVRVINGKMLRHERGLAYVPYDLYRRIERISGMSVKEQAKKNLCKASGRIIQEDKMEIETEFEVRYKDSVGNTFPDDTPEEEIKSFVEEHLEDYCREHKISRRDIIIKPELRDENGSTKTN